MLFQSTQHPVIFRAKLFFIRFQTRHELEKILIKHALISKSWCQNYATHASDSNIRCIRFRNYIRFRSSVRHYSSDGYRGSSVIALRSSRAHAPSRRTDWAGTPTVFASACPRGHMWRCTDSNVTKRRGTFADMFCKIKDRQSLFAYYQDVFLHFLPPGVAYTTGLSHQFRPPIALRTDLSHITTELWEIPLLRMAH